MNSAGDTRRPWYVDGWAFGTTFLLCLLVFATYYANQPPASKPASAPPTEFSAERALVYDRGLAPEPHPAGSAANVRTQQYIVDTMNALGVPAQHVASPVAHGNSAGMRNVVLARLPGTANTKAVMLEAHYDSVPYGPGTADDCAGVSAMIEIARALKASPPLKNDVIFVFSDAEEAGMLGAAAFVDHPWFKEVGTLIGFETRGNRGKTYMFETSAENGWLIRQLAQSGVSVCTSSCMGDIYYRLPFRADFGVFKEAGLKGYNLAFVDNFAQYHTKNDDPAHLNLASLQDHGEHGLALARQLGNVPLECATAPDVTYFDILGKLCYYPKSWDIPLMLFTTALFIAVILLGLARGHLTGPGLLGGLVLFPLIIAATSAAATLYLAFLYGPEKLYTFVMHDITNMPDIYLLQQNNLYGIAMALLAIGVFVLLAGAAVRFIRPQNLAVGALALWFVLMCLVARYMGGALYAAQWTLLFASLGLALSFLTHDPQRPSPALVCAWSLFAVPGIFLLTFSYQAVLSFIFVLAAPVLVLIPSLLLGLAIPQIALITRRSRLWVPVVCFIIVAVLTGIGLRNSEPTPDRPQFDCVAYMLDLDSNQASWLSTDPAPDEWTSQFFAKNPQATAQAIEPPQHTHLYRSDGHDFTGYPVMKAPAPVAAGAGPAIRVVADSVHDGLRELVLHIDSSHATSMLLQTRNGAGVLSASVFGQPLNPGRSEWHLNVHLFPREGLDLTLCVEPDKPVDLAILETSHGLPDIPGVVPRPGHIAPEPNTFQRHKPFRDGEVFVTKTFHLDPPTA